MADIKSKIGSNYKENLSKTSTQLIQEEIDRLKAASRGTEDEDILEYKASMEKERKFAEKRDRKLFGSIEEERLSKTGKLNPSVISLMMSDEITEEEKYNLKTDKSSSKVKKSKNSKHKKSKKDKKDKKKKASKTDN
jgi:hypothetical protein